MVDAVEMNRLRAEYASKSDDELTILATDMNSLTEVAKLVLAEAVMKRGIVVPEAQSQDTSPVEDKPERHLVTVRWFGNIADAWPAKSRLDSAGIQSFLADENVGRLFPVMVGGVKLQVRLEDAASATQVLDSELSPEDMDSESEEAEKAD